MSTRTRLVAVTVANVFITIIAIVVPIVVIAQTNWKHLVGVDVATAEVQEANSNMVIIQQQLAVLQANLTTIMAWARRFI